MWNWLRNLLLIVVLIAIIILSFWISFMIGRRMLSPAKKLPTAYLLTEEAKSVLPPEITLEVEGLTFETAPAERSHKAVKTVKPAPAKVAAAPKKVGKKRPVSHKAVSAAPVKTPAVSASGKYAVQAGAFSRQSNAQALEKELKAKGFSASVRKVGKLFRVDAGRFASASAAKLLEQKLTASGFEAVIRRDN
ncbi:MAG TPA: SPOR domain-containing protein [Candidatus Omnitrophota bacterium]|nr:SPOR domain-containing protein [Candidatus Omnitrophota bacterium]